MGGSFLRSQESVTDERSSLQGLGGPGANDHQLASEQPVPASGRTPIRELSHLATLEAEAIEFRDRRMAELDEHLVVASVQESIDRGRAVEQTGPRASRNRLQTVTLLDAITAHGFDAAFGGARRERSSCGSPP